MQQSKGVYLSLQYLYAQRTGGYCVSHTNTSFSLFAMYKTHMPHVNFTKKVQWEEIKLCAIFQEQLFQWGEWKLEEWVGGVA